MIHGDDNLFDGEILYIFDATPDTEDRI